MEWARLRSGARNLGEEAAQAPQPVQPAYPFDPENISVFSALHDTVAGEIRVTAEVGRAEDCLAMTSCTVRDLPAFSHLSASLFRVLRCSSAELGTTVAIPPGLGAAWCGVGAAGLLMCMCENDCASDCLS